MRQYFLHLLFFATTIPAYSQNSILQKTSTGKTLENDRWNLDKYVWSHTHYKTSTNDKPVINFEAIDNWTGIGNDHDLSISPDGKYFVYGIQQIATRRRDSLIIQSTVLPWRKSFKGENVKGGFFTADSRQYIFQDKEGLCFLQLSSGERQNVKGVLNYNLNPTSTKTYSWLAYQLQSKEVVLQDLITGKEKRIENVSSYEFEGSGTWLVCQLGKNAISELLIYNLATGEEKRFPWVDGYVFDESSKLLLLKTVEKRNDVTTTSLQNVNLADAAMQRIWSTSEKNTLLNSYAFDNSGNQVVLVVSDSMSSNSIWYWKKGMDKAMVKGNNQSKGIDANLIIQGPVAFTKDGQHIQFILQPKPDIQEPDPDAVKVDVWNYKDSILQSSQAYLLKMPVVYTAILNIETGRVLQLERENQKLAGLTGDFALIRETPDGDRFWEHNLNSDNYWNYDKSSVWIVSLANGTRRILPAKRLISFDLSPKGNYLVSFDTTGNGNYYSYELHTGKVALISGGAAWGKLGYRDYYRLNQKKQPCVTVYGMQDIGWLDGETGKLVSDGYDIWQLDPSGKKPPVNLTNGYGRLNHTQFWLIGEERRSFSSKDTFLLGAFNHQNKFNGFYKKILGTSGNPELLYMGPFFFMQGGNMHGLTSGMKPVKADNANVWIVQRQTTTEAPNYFLTSDFKTFKLLTNYQPHKNYNWLTAEFHHFKQLDGTISQGILYKPENFDPSKKYPLIISFYAQLTDQLYQYPLATYINAPDISDNPAWMVSHGYLVFVPDIYFTVDRYGPSTVNTMDGAARYLKSLPYVDGQHLGVCGHSNSGRYGYYLLTHSRSFAAMSLGSGHGGTDMLSVALSDDDGLKWAEKGAYGTGLGNIWRNKERWVDHIALLQADRVYSPLLLFHNKGDGDKTSYPFFETGDAVILAKQLFTALRRLEKPVWWLQYDEGGHRVDKLRDKKDYTIRTTQFFDHYLKGAPAPRWMKEGVPYKLKGMENRYEIDVAE